MTAEGVSAEGLTVPEPSGRFSARFETGSVGWIRPLGSGVGEDRNDLRFSLDIAQLFRQIIGLFRLLVLWCALQGG